MAEWSLCLTSREGRKIVKLSSTSSTKDLMDLSSTQFKSQISGLKYGFPPKTMAVDTDTPISSLMSNQERIQVEFGAASKVASKEKKKTASRAQTNDAPAAASTSRTKSKRAAAQKATENMPAVIKAQEAMMKQQQISRKRPRTNASAPKKPPPKPKFTADAGQGRRLADGATVAPARASKGSRRNKLLSSSSSSSDMSEALMGALNDKGKMGRVLRKGMNNAVQASYETSRAFSRLAAIQAKKYTMQQTGNSLEITFQGSVDKKQQTETVDCIPRDVLEAVLRGIHASNQEAMRPENLALLSPRVLWSMVFYLKEGPNTTNTNNDVMDFYKTLLPDLDWSFLRRRQQQLSAKAKENLRQAQEETGEEPMNVEQAEEAVAAVEHAMEHLQDYESTERKSKQAQAALARMQTTNGDASNGEWKLLTPCEPDRDELRECIEQAPPSTSDNVTTIVTKLMKVCHIHNWRELANVTDPRVLEEKLGIPIDNIQQWIAKAQYESVDEIMVEVCDGNIEAVRALTEHARTGTPKELATWRSIPDLLYQQIGSGVVDKTQLATWCRRAHQVLQELVWLGYYQTPVE